MLRLSQTAVRILWVSALVVAASAAHGQNYPSKPIRIVTGSAGSNVDVCSRLLAPGLGSALGQEVVVDNRAGAVGGGPLVAKAPPDGYTMLLIGGSFWIGPLMRDDTPYDPVKDFSPMALLTKAPEVLVVHPALPVKSVKELIALAKAHPGELNYGAGGAGGASHLAGELFKALAGVKIVAVQYSNDSTQYADLLAGRTQLTFGNIGVLPYVKAGRLRALAVTSAQPSQLIPGVPPIAAAGVPGYESVGATAMFAPAKTPTAIVNRVSQEVARILNVPDVKDKFLKVGLEPAGTSPEGLAAAMKSEMTMLGKVIKDAGIRAD